jgi:hypothetical protein
MTVALGAVAGVAVVALVASLLAWRSSSKRLAGAQARFAQSAAELEESRAAGETASRQLDEERRRRSEADGRARDAEERASSAEAAMEALIAARSPAVLAEIERVRLEREWREMSGPEVPLPVRWNGSLEAALEIELEIIREVTGTPGRLEAGGGAGVRAGGGDDSVDDAKLWMIGTLGCELVRVVARYADEMVVRLEPGPAMAPAVVAEALGARAAPDLSSVEMAAKALGVSLVVEQTEDGFVVRMSAD